MLKNYGFHVIDLGKDVPSEEIIETAKKEDADIIALSALMKFFSYILFYLK